MNDLLFENKYKRNKSVAKEVWGYWFFKKPLMKLLFLLLGLNALICIVAIFMNVGNKTEMLYTLIIDALLPLIIFASYYSQVKSMTNREGEIGNGEDILCTVAINEKDIELSMLDSLQTVPLDRIKYGFLTENYIGLVTQARLLFILKKDSFTKGSLDGLLSFLSDRKIKIKK